MEYKVQHLERHPHSAKNLDAPPLQEHLPAGNCLEGGVN